MVASAMKHMSFLFLFLEPLELFRQHVKPPYPYNEIISRVIYALFIKNKTSLLLWLPPLTHVLHSLL